MFKSREEKKEKCFVIMPISDQGDYTTGHFAKVYEQIIKPSIEEAGYEAYRVDENNICDSIIGKIFDAIQECPMAVCDLSNRNPNVLYELGLRQAYDKPVVLIQDDKTDKIFDVSGISTVFYKSARLYEDVIEARIKIKEAILSTKEGKTNTLAKVMKVNAADFSKVEVSQDDKTNVILGKIYNEIMGLKNKQQVDYTLDKAELNGNDTFKGTILEMLVKYEDLKKGNEFIEKVNQNIPGLIISDQVRMQENIWKHEIYFTNLTYSEEAVDSIIELANDLDIEVIGSYVL